MKTINVTFISSDSTAHLECTCLLRCNPDIDLVAISSGPDQRDAWTALSRSHVAVIDEANIHHHGNESLVMLLAYNPGVKFLVVMERFDEDRMLWAITRGARGVMLRRELRQLLGKAVRQVHKGEVWVPRNLLNPMREMLNLQEGGSPDADPIVTNRTLRLH
jgi:DNA-binding NarL/FixJ family response regulator